MCLFSHTGGTLYRSCTQEEQSPRRWFSLDSTRYRNDPIQAEQAEESLKKKKEVFAPCVMCDVGPAILLISTVVPSVPRAIGLMAAF